MSTNGHHPEPAPVLSVRHLRLDLAARPEPVTLVHDVTFSVRPRETVGLVGESGSGKTLTASAIMGILPPPVSVAGGSIELHGEELVGASRRVLAERRGKVMTMVFQDALRSLNPVYSVGDQIAEVARRHLGLGRRAAWARAVEMLDAVGIKEPARRAHDHPHQFSGGMCQRAMIAMALVCNPSLLIADEPTTALDVTVQRGVLRLLRQLQQELDLAILFITHDLGVVAEMCDDVVVMYAGEVVEHAGVLDTFLRPRHPYTAGLLDAIPRPTAAKTFGCIPGVVPQPQAWPAGCRFHPRCAHATPACVATAPALRDLGGRSVRCDRTGEIVVEGIGDGPARG